MADPRDARSSRTHYGNTSGENKFPDKRTASRAVGRGGRTGGARFAIPQVSLLELVRLDVEQARKGIEMLYGAPVYRLRGQLLPLCYFNQVLELTTATAAAKQASDAVNIVILQADGRQFGLVVDEINDTEEIVVKPLGKQLKGIACFAGATRV